MNGILSTWGSAAPYLQDIIVTIAVPGIVAWFVALLRKWGVQVEDSRRTAYTATAQRVAGELLTSIIGGHIDLSSLVTTSAGGAPEPNLAHPAMADAVAKVQKAAPDALKHFGIQNNPQAIGQKIIGMLGPLLASGVAGPIGGIVGGLLSGPAATAPVR